MSAAEKLEAHDAAIHAVFAEEPFDEDWTAELLDRYTLAMGVVRNALPEIIAVVSRAERLTEWVIGDHVAFPDARELRAALSALDEALPQIGSAPPPEGATSP